VDPLLSNRTHLNFGLDDCVQGVHTDDVEEDDEGRDENVVHVCGELDLVLEFSICDRVYFCSRPSALTSMLVHLSL
jgi:hypothetical protein